MANTTKHDRQLAVQKATDLFWKKGYHATSMRNIQESIEMHPGSIYANFGSKEGLFKETLQNYTHKSLAYLDICAATAPSPIEALKMFIQNAVIGNGEPAPSNMCMLVKTIAELTEDQTELSTETKRLLNSIGEAFAALLAQAIESGEIDKTRDPIRLARYLQVQLMGLRAYTRVNNDDTCVKALIDDAFECLR